MNAKELQQVMTDNARAETMYGDLVEPFPQETAYGTLLAIYNEQTGKITWTMNGKPYPATKARQALEGVAATLNTYQALDAYFAGQPFSPEMDAWMAAQCNAADTLRDNGRALPEYSERDYEYCARTIGSIDCTSAYIENPAVREFFKDRI